MKIYLHDLTEEGVDYEGVLPAGIVDAKREDPVICPGPVHYHVRAICVSDELLVDGTLNADLEMRCRRCDIRFTGEIKNLPYHYDQPLDPLTEYADLTEDMREAIILAFPSYPVCDTSCKGLCPQCGMNLNEQTCECSPPTDNRWSALDGL